MPISSRIPVLAKRVIVRCSAEVSRRCTRARIVAPARHGSARPDPTTCLPTPNHPLPHLPRSAFQPSSPSCELLRLCDWHRTTHTRPGHRGGSELPEGQLGRRYFPQLSSLGG